MKTKRETTLADMHEKSWRLYGLITSGSPFSGQAVQQGQTVWRVHPNTYAEMVFDRPTSLAGPQLEMVGGEICWLGIELERDPSVPVGEIEFRWTVRSGV